MNNSTTTIFEHKVKRLFCDIVTNKVTSKDAISNANNLLQCLLHKVTQPIKYWWNDKGLNMLYYNVSLTIDVSLKAMQVSYVGNNSVTFTGLQKCDIFQLSEFVLALECDIPQWHHLMATEQLLETKKQAAERKLKSEIECIIQKWICSSKQITDKEEEALRLQYFNVQAAILMLQHDNPYWKNKKSNAEILKEFQTYHIDAPLEQWYNNWIALAEDCATKKTEREAKMEADRRKK